MTGGWDPAPTVLSRGSGSCSEYTYLFVAMCRAAGIPARYEAGGHVRDTLPYVDTVFHRWHQVYLPPYGWVNIDATWDDKNYPANQARYFGAASNTLFATTVSGGGSNKISWAYNSANSPSGLTRTKQMIWTDVVTSVEPADERLLPETFTLRQNYPNPFNPQTTASFELPKADRLTIAVYDILGREVKRIVSDEAFPAGYHSVQWNAVSSSGVDVSTGIYFLRISTASGLSKTVRMSLIR